MHSQKARKRTNRRTVPTYQVAFAIWRFRTSGAGKIGPPAIIRSSGLPPIGRLRGHGRSSIGRRFSTCDPIPTLTVIDASWYGWIGCTCPSAEKFNSAGATEASVDYCRQCRHTLCFWNCKPDRILACRGQRLLQTGCPERLTNVVHGSVAGNRMCGNAAPLENR